MLTINSRKRASRTAALAAPMLVLALSLAACSPARPETGASSAAGGAPAAAGSYAEWELNYTRCLRDEGIDIDDPDPETGVDDVPHDDAYRAAADACSTKVGGPPGAADSDANEEKFQDQLNLAQCLREHGFDIADPPRDQAIAIEGEIPDATWTACAADAGDE